MLLAVMVMGFSQAFISCKDDDEDEKKESKTQEQKDEEAYQARDAFWSVVSQLIDPDDITDDYLDKTFQPTIGQVSETNPTVRIVSVNDVADKADNIFNIGSRLTDQSLLCVSLVHSPRQLLWGYHDVLCNDEKHRFNQDEPGQYTQMIRDFGSTSITEKLASEGNELNPLHPAAYAAYHYFKEVFPDEMRWADNFTAHTDWFLPTAGHWTLFLKGLGAWNSSYDGEAVQRIIADVYREAGFDEKVTINGYDYTLEDVNPFGRSVWTAPRPPMNMPMPLPWTREAAPASRKPLRPIRCKSIPSSS